MGGIEAIIKRQINELNKLLNRKTKSTHGKKIGVTTLPKKRYQILGEFHKEFVTSHIKPKEKDEQKGNVENRKNDVVNIMLDGNNGTNKINKEKSDVSDGELEC